MPVRRYLSAFIIILFLCVSMTGCLITYHSHTYISPSEHSVSKIDLDKIEPGVTTKDWVLDTFGPPTRERQLKDDSEILMYERCERTEHHVSFFLIFTSNRSENKKETLSIEIQDGVVQKYWMD